MIQTWKVNMISPQEEKALISMVPSDADSEDRRAAYAVITGFRDEKTPSQISAYYSVSDDLVLKWYNFFSFDNQESSTKGKRGRKSKDIAGYLKLNTGKTITPKTLSEEIGISLPTFYNFYNANRGFFKKVKRGEFEIVNPDEQRNLSK